MAVLPEMDSWIISKYNTIQYYIYMLDCACIYYNVINNYFLN